jgi:hypothetical protein
MQMLTLPTLLRDTALASLVVCALAFAGAVQGAWSNGSAVAVGIGAMVTCINLQTLRWAVAGMEKGDFYRRLLVQQSVFFSAVIACLLVRVPAVGFSIGFMCFFPVVALHAFSGLKRPMVQEIG